MYMAAQQRAWRRWNPGRSFDEPSMAARVRGGTGDGAEQRQGTADLGGVGGRSGAAAGHGGAGDGWQRPEQRTRGGRGREGRRLTGDDEVEQIDGEVERRDGEVDRQSDGEAQRQGTTAARQTAATASEAAG